MDMSSLTSKYDWDIRRGGPGAPITGRDMTPPGMRGYRDPDISIRPTGGGSVIEVHVLDMNTGRRTVKMFDLYHECGISTMGMSMAGMATMGMHSCLAEIPSENESISRKLLKLFL